MIDMIGGEQLRNMIRYGAAALQAQKQPINDLNVFPVPDGDTGTNMSLTMNAAVTALADCQGLTVGEVAAKNASALLRGARGNSGVILSLLFRGFSKALKGKEQMDGVDFASALSEGVSAAYGAVMKPAEGTILTVSRLAAERAAEACMDNSSFQYVMEQAIARGYEALDNTTNQNPVLKKAGVVDAGGKGFLTIMDGMLSFLNGEEIAATVEVEPQTKAKADFSTFETGDITFGYCTEFICSRDNDKDPGLLRPYLNGLGDSVVVVDDDEIIKVHVHTNHPGKVLEEALTYGALLKVKIENMREQHTEITSGEPAAPAEDSSERKIAPNEKKYGFVSVCAGAGLEEVFRDLGVDGMVSGGQTMNPSTEDLLRVVDATPAEIVFVLPNNKNIIMAAQQCIPLSETKKVVVIETKTVPEGIAAMMAVDPDAGEEELVEAMLGAAANVRTAQITYAARNSDMDGLNIHEGDYLALLGGKLFGNSPDIGEQLTALANTAKESDAEFITLFYGEDVTEEQAAEAEEIFASICPDAEVSVISGGQPVYYYLISIE